MERPAKRGVATQGRTRRRRAPAIDGSLPRGAKRQSARADAARVASAALVGELASAFAHDLSQPLNALAARLEACVMHLRSARLDPLTVLGVLAEAAKDGELTADLLRRMRDCTRHRVPQPTVVDVRDLVARVLGAVAPDAEQHGLTLCGDPTPDPLHARVDAFQIEQVLASIVGQAVDALAQTRPRGGEVRLRATSGPRRTVVVDVSYRASAPPNGDAAQRALLIDRAVVRKIVETHGGTLSTVRTAGGTTVRLTLPAAARGRADVATRQ